MEHNIEDRCMHYQLSRDQRKSETDRGLNHDDTMGYEKIGCYDCDGFRTDCKLNKSLKTLMSD